MKRERGEDAHEDADTVEPQVKVDDAHGGVVGSSDSSEVLWGRIDYESAPGGGWAPNLLK